MPQSEGWRERFLSREEANLSEDSTAARAKGVAR
jgi:hypothetical protein